MVRDLLIYKRSYWKFEVKTMPRLKRGGVSEEAEAGKSKPLSKLQTCAMITCIIGTGMIIFSYKLLAGAATSSSNTLTKKGGSAFSEKISRGRLRDYRVKSLGSAGRHTVDMETKSYPLLSLSEDGSKWVVPISEAMQQGFDSYFESTDGKTPPDNIEPPEDVRVRKIDHLVLISLLLLLHFPHTFKLARARISGRVAFGHGTKGCAWVRKLPFATAT